MIIIVKVEDADTFDRLIRLAGALSGSYDGFTNRGEVIFTTLAAANDARLLVGIVH
jgi:hypothetical protein